MEAPMFKIIPRITIMHQGPLVGISHGQTTIIRILADMLPEVLALKTTMFLLG